MGENKIDEKWLESVLKDNKNEDIDKILSIDVKPAVADGENYVSKIFRLSILAITNRGDEKQLSIIMKRKLSNELQNKGMESDIDAIFHKEYKVYTEHLVKISNYTICKEQLWPECIATIPGSEIYFRDLKAAGYDLVQRSTGLDYHHALLVINNLANFHAASSLAVANGKLDPADYKEYFMAGTNRPDDLPITNEVELMVDVIRKEWPPQWSNLADRLEKYQNGILSKRACEISSFKNENLNVFNHGDPWVTNFMFKYDTGGNPVSIKFLDFQLYHYNTFGLDLCYFLNTSVGPDLKRKHLNDWIESYCETFSKCLQLNNMSSLPCPTPEMVKHEIKRLALFSLHISLIIRPVVQSDPQNTLTISEIWDDLQLNSKKRRIYQNSKYANVMKSDLPYLLDLIET